MFVKHVRGEEWEVNGGTHVFECCHYNLREMQDNKILVLLDDGATAFEVEKDCDELYIMNDNGRTVDSYSWADTNKSYEVR